MTRYGPKGPPLFDVLAPRRREPSAFEVAIQAALAKQDHPAAPDHEVPAHPAAENPDPDVSEAGPGSRSSGSHLVAVQLDDEPPLLPAPTGSASAATGAVGPGPRIAAFAAATGAATRPRSKAVSDDSQPAPAAMPAPQAGVSSDAEPAGPPDLSAPDGSAALEATTDPGASGGDATPRPSSDGAFGAPAAAAVAPVDGLPAGQPLEELPSSPSVSDRTEGPAAQTPAPDAQPNTGFAEDDDFGPLVLPEEPRRRWRRRTTGDVDEPKPVTTPEAPPTDPAPAAMPRPASTVGRSRRLLALSVSALAVSVLALAVWRLLPSEATAASPTAPVVNRAQTGEVSMVTWHGMELPVSGTAGPRVRGETVSGFEKSPLGAAIAAANLVVRVDPHAGSAVFEPTLATQVVGDAQRLRDSVLAQAGAPAEAGVPGSLAGWRIESTDLPAELTVHLAVGAPDGEGLDFAVPLAWVDGDWRIDVPAKGPFFPTAPLSGPYTPFAQEGAAS